MAEKTCAACECKLEGESIKVKIGGKTVEVCCDDCAHVSELEDRRAKHFNGGAARFD